ncbi:MAG: hypothetical protein ACEPO8_03640 [Rhodothermaceae bacterium]
MNTKFSELELISSNVLGSFFSAVEYDQNEPMPLNKIPVEIDVKTSIDESDNAFILLLDLCSNPKGEIKGAYSYSVLMQGVFKVKDYDSRSKEEIDAYLLYSAVPSLINLARGYLMNISTYYPYGKYTLPMLDLGDIIEKLTTPES